jgi:hypothetical protein
MGLNLTAVKSASSYMGGPLSEQQVRFLRDVQGFVEYAIRNGLSLKTVYSLLQHDFEAALDAPDGLYFNPAGVMPRLRDMAKELHQIADDPQAMKAIRQADADFNG